MLINFGGSVAISTVDWPSKSSTVIFLRGCPLRCPYCHNHKLWSGNNYVDTDHVKNLIRESLPFISAVVISGGEPLMQEGIFEIAGFAKSAGLHVGIETSGYYPEVAERLIKKNFVDKFFVDVKATPEKYEEITKNKYAFSRLERFLKIVKNSNVQFELRTTIIKGLIGTRTNVRKSRNGLLRGLQSVIHGLSNKVCLEMAILRIWMGFVCIQGMKYLKLPWKLRVLSKM
jgi:pyruvate formate lyase activating enzyme